MKRTSVSLVLALACSACGSSSPSSSAAADTSTSTQASASSGAETTETATAGPPYTRERLVAMRDAVMAAYPAPFEQTYANLTAEYGAPMRTSDNMYQWFAADGATCVQLYVTRANDGGHAAAGILDSEPADCQ